MGDTVFPNENYILNEYYLTKLYIIKVGHHGDEAIEKLENVSSEVCKTSIHGVICLILKENIIMNTCLWVTLMLWRFI